MMLISQGRSSGYLADKSEATGYGSGTKNPVGFAPDHPPPGGMATCITASTSVLARLFTTPCN
jgi:hypothetical protein